MGREHLEDPVVHFQNREIEGAAAQVIHRDSRPLAELVQAVSKRRSGGFIHDSNHLQPCQLARAFRCRALGIVEIRRHRDHRLGDRHAHPPLGDALHFP